MDKCKWLHSVKDKRYHFTDIVSGKKVYMCTCECGKQFMTDGGLFALRLYTGGQR